MSPADELTIGGGQGQDQDREKSNQMGKLTGTRQTSGTQGQTRPDQPGTREAKEQKEVKHGCRVWGHGRHVDATASR